MHGKSRQQNPRLPTQIMKVGDMICVVDFHDVCLRLCRKVAVMEFGLYQDWQHSNPVAFDLKTNQNAFRQPGSVRCNGKLETFPKGQLNQRGSRGVEQRAERWGGEWKNICTPQRELRLHAYVVSAPHCHHCGLPKPATQKNPQIGSKVWIKIYFWVTSA